jgi:hypothetical protein
MSEVTDLSASNKQKLVTDMKGVVADAEEILRATAGVAGDKMGDLRERIGERLRATPNFAWRMPKRRWSTAPRLPRVPPMIMSRRIHGAPSALPRASVCCLA